MLEFLTTVNGLVWGVPLMVLLIGTGILLTVRLGLLQVVKLPMALKLIFAARNTGSGDINSFQALCTALAATVGTGNIVGVATAVKAGGPGALFWMWLAAFFGMATKYAEGVLAVKYRVMDENGNASGGPMYYIKNGLGKKWIWLAYLFSLLGALAAFGIGNIAQVNSIAESVNQMLQAFAYLPAGAGDLGVASPFRRQLSSCDPLGECYRPSQTQRYCDRSSHGIQKPRRFDTL